MNKSPEEQAAELYPKFEDEISGYRKDYNKITGLQREAWLSGLQVGVEILDWAAENCLYKSVDGETIWMLKSDIYKEFRKSELLEFYLNHKYQKP